MPLVRGLPAPSQVDATQVAQVQPVPEQRQVVPALHGVWKSHAGAGQVDAMQVPMPVLEQT